MKKCFYLFVGIVFFWSFLITIAGSVLAAEKREPTPSDMDRIVTMVSQAITDWQNKQGLGVTEGVETIVVEEYLSSIEDCQTDFQSLGKKDIEFYVFEYLDQTHEGKSYSPQIVCDPFRESSRRKGNRYGLLRVASDPGTFVAIDNHAFDKRLRDFLVTVGNHTVSVFQSKNRRRICSRTVTVKSGQRAQVSCKRS